MDGLVGSGSSIFSRVCVLLPGSACSVHLHAVRGRRIYLACTSFSLVLYLLCTKKIQDMGGGHSLMPFCFVFLGWASILARLQGIASASSLLASWEQQAVDQHSVTLVWVPWHMEPKRPDPRKWEEIRGRRRFLGGPWWW